MTSEERHAELEQAREQAASAVDAAAAQMRARPTKRQATRTAVLAALVASVLAVAVSVAVSALAFGESARVAAAQADAQQESAQNRKLAQQAFDSAKLANNQLAARGQQPVSVPAPDPGDPTKTIVAAATAAVLSQLPPAPGPTADQIAGAVGRYLTLNPAVVPPDRILAAVTTYLQTNPPPPGPKGDTGAQGKNGADGANGADGKNGADGQPGAPGKDGRDGPTLEQVRDAFVQYAKDNPTVIQNVLCDGTQWTTVKGIPSESTPGTTYTISGCITAETAAPPTSPTPS